MRGIFYRWGWGISRLRSEHDIARGVPLSGSDCRVARRAPRNDKRGVRAPRNRLVAKLRREMIGEGFLRVMRVKIAVCSNATNKIFTRFTYEKTRIASALYFATSLMICMRISD
ncbi:MAG: hypothetical protein LBL66_02640 [Clostridiales bacterium]|nr:hypothetical protein [Clostridiales bacterium]